MKMGKRVKIAVIGCGILVLSSIALFFSPLILPSPYPVEEYHKSANGRRWFEDQHFRQIDSEYRLQGIEKHIGEKARITRLVFGTDMEFVFTDNRKVFALTPREAGAEPSPFKSWQWNRDPHEFPYFEEPYPYSGP